MSVFKMAAVLLFPKRKEVLREKRADFPKKISLISVPKSVISQSEAVSFVLMSWNIKSLTYDLMVTTPNLGTLNK